MNANLFAEWLKEVDASMKKNSRHILLFLDNAPCHPIDVQLSNVKLVFFPPNTTSVVQPLDQGVIHSFKCFYRQMLVKHIIAQCTVAHSCDQITVTALDACRWIDLAWNKVTTTTISNTFHKAGFSHMSSDRQSTNDNISPVNEDEDPIKQLEDLLFHVDVSSNRMSAVELVSIDSDIPVFNEWTDESDAIRQMAEVHIIDEMDNVDEEDSIEEVVPKLPEALDMLRKLHLFASTEHPELHSLLSDSSRRWRMFIWTGSHPNKAASLIISSKVDFVNRFVNKIWNMSYLIVFLSKETSWRKKAQYGICKDSWTANPH